jgi:acetyl esterase/lipase
MNTEKETDRSTRRNESSAQGFPAKVAKTPAQRVTPPIVYRLPRMDEVKVHANLKYSDVENPYLMMDVYAPPDLSLNGLRPIVLCIPGGAGAQYQPKDWGIFQSWGRLIAAAGMVGVVFTHRLGYPKPCLSEAAADVNCAIAHIRANANSFNADPDRVCLAAWSAGGALLAPAMRERPAFIRCLAAFYALLDCQQSATHIENESAASVTAFSPITCVPTDASSMVPMFVARAGVDEVPAMNDSIDRFVGAAIAANAPITFMNHPSGEHGFDNQNDDHRSREIIQSAIAFMRANLR